MKNIYRNLVVFMLAGAFMLPFTEVMGGNKDRAGQAGASELLINPWARSTGWGGANISCVRGLEAQYGNVAGVAFTPKTEVIFSHTQWMKGSDVTIMSFGLAQRLSESSVFALGIMSMRFGDIDITTVDLPEGGLGTFSPNLMNIALSYAKTFSNSIYGGLTLKIIQEGISDVTAQGVAIDAGIQYVTGENENIKFGISLKNIGPTMRFRGDGLSFRGYIPGQDNQFTIEQRSAAFELPSSLNIGAAYDFLFNESNKLTLAGTFNSNSFTKDLYLIGAEYNFKSVLMLRAGYMYEDGITKKADRTTAFTGPTAGLSVEIPINKEKGTTFSLDYSYRATDPYDGTHSIGARINL